MDLRESKQAQAPCVPSLRGRTHHSLRASNLLRGVEEPLALSSVWGWGSSSPERGGGEGKEEEGEGQVGTAPWP